MKLATVAIDGRKTWGVVEGDTFLDVGVALASRYADLKRDGGSFRPGIGNAGESRSQGRLEVGIARGERNANVQEGVTFDDPPGLPSVDRNGGQLHTSSPF